MPPGQYSLSMPLPRSVGSRGKGSVNHDREGGRGESFDGEGGRRERLINKLNSLAQEPAKLTQPTPFT